ncbi:unnamed protein product [Cyprideis torosa]|uniref:Uncharacterized protein n=1 Tax=Cyprideis torosa TaxID=163714 RepID=A0A7R8ZL49_9CRUS|nr:unnamed protein product [Cyprideis torosa]CAG0882855.1 unnamed protein product [Cyprideis torosa]
MERREELKWFFFDIANYGAGAAQWTWGLEKCFDLDFTTTSSMRYVGDSNNHNASTLSFYELESFRSFGESSYNGQSICLQPFPDLRPVFYNTVNSIGIPAVKSIAIGCYGDKVVRGFSPDKEGLFSFPIKQDN